MSLPKDEVAELSKRILDGKDTLINAEEFKKLMKVHPLPLLTHACKVMGWMKQEQMFRAMGLATSADAFQKLIMDAPIEARALAIGLIALVHLSP